MPRALMSVLLIYNSSAGTGEVSRDDLLCVVEVYAGGDRATSGRHQPAGPSASIGNCTEDDHVRLLSCVLSLVPL